MISGSFPNFDYFISRFATHLEELNVARAILTAQSVRNNLSEKPSVDHFNLPDSVISGEKLTLNIGKQAVFGKTLVKAGKQCAIGEFHFDY